MTGIFTYGIDVSHWSKAIDWNQVVVQKVHFAFAKASELSKKGGKVTKFKDPMFDTYWSDLGTKNIRRGAYHFCRPGLDPVASMQFFFSVYTPKTGDLLPTLDIEDQYADDTSVPRKDKVAQISAMIDSVAKQLGDRKPIIYTKQRVWSALGNPGDFGGCPLWVIDYNHNPRPKLPNSWSNFTFWQTDENKKMAGIQGDFDPDFFNGRPEEIGRYCV